MKTKIEILNDNGFKYTKKAQCNYPRYDSLYECYERPSYAKERAYEYCMKLVNKLDGYNYGICGYNCMIFSFVFNFNMDGKKYIAFITRDYNRYYEV